MNLTKYLKLNMRESGKNHHPRTEPLNCSAILVCSCYRLSLNYPFPLAVLVKQETCPPVKLHAHESSL